MPNELMDFGDGSIEWYEQQWRAIVNCKGCISGETAPVAGNEMCEEHFARFVAACRAETARIAKEKNELRMKGFYGNHTL